MVPASPNIQLLKLNKLNFFIYLKGEKGCLYIYTKKKLNLLSYLQNIMIYLSMNSRKLINIKLYSLFEESFSHEKNQIEKNRGTKEKIVKNYLNNFEQNPGYLKILLIPVSLYFNLNRKYVILLNFSRPLLIPTPHIRPL